MITLLVLTYRNPDHLNRALLFYKKLLPSAKMLIADSNSAEDKKRCKDYIKKISSVDYKPLHLEFDCTTTFAEKVSKAVRCINTPYSLIVGDDDFFSPEGILRAILFLEAKSEYVFAYGHQYGFLFNQEGIKWYFSGYYENPRSFAQENPLERLDSFTNKYAAIFYSVFRTDVLKSIIEVSVRYAPELVFFDNMVSMQALLQGKGYFTEEPFCFKEMSNLSTSDTYNYLWFLGKNFEGNKKLMEIGLEEELQNLSFLSAEEASRQARKMVDIFIETTFYSMYPQYLPGTIVSVVKRKLKKILPACFLRKISLVKGIFRTDMVEVGGAYLFDKGSSYSRDFEEVKNAIKNSQIYCYREGFEDARQL